MLHALRVLRPEDYFIEDEPYYESLGGEIAVLEAAYANGLPAAMVAVAADPRSGARHGA